VYVCELCGHETPCIQNGIYKEPFKGYEWNWDKEVGTCPYEEAMVADFQLIEIEDFELINYFTKTCPHYTLTPICNYTKGICPKIEDGKEEGCHTKAEYKRRMNL